ASSRATSSQRLPISTPITRLPSMPTSIMLVGSGPSTRLCTGLEPHLPFVFRTAEKPAGLQLSTVVETFRDLEVPPALPSWGDRANTQPGTATGRNGPGSAAHRGRTACQINQSLGRAALRPGHAPYAATARPACAIIATRTGGCFGLPRRQ